LEIILAATGLVAWSKLISFTEHPDLGACEIDTFATGSCTSRHASPEAHVSDPTADRRHLAMVAAFAHRATPAGLPYPPEQISQTSLASTGVTTPTRPHEKSRLKAIPFT
jgi:hypothetical protein